MAWGLPSAFTSGNVLTAAQMNQLRDSVAYLHGDAGAITLAAALQAPTLNVPTFVDTNGTTKGMIWGSNGLLTNVAQTILPAGSVTAFAWCTGGVQQASSTPVAIPGTLATYISNSTFYNFTANTLNFRVNANGSVDAYLTSASPTVYVMLTILWR